MKLRAADFRRESKDALTGKWGLAIGTYLVASILGGAASSGGVSFNFSFNENDPSIGIIGGADGPTAILVALGGFLIIAALMAIVISIAMFCLGSIIDLGYSQFNLNIIDYKETKFSQLFGYFKHWSVAIVSGLLRALYTFLWTLLFIIPGIIAAYSYRMTPYILAENPDMAPNDAITRSKEMMVGNKWRLFCLEFSYIGWDILCVLTFGILSFWIESWKRAASAAFYRSLSPLQVEESDDDGFTGDDSASEEIPPQTFI